LITDKKLMLLAVDQ